MKEHIKCIEKAVATKEPRFTLRTLRGIPGTRRKLSHPLLRKLINGYLPLREYCKLNTLCWCPKENSSIYIITIQGPDVRY